MPEWMPMDVLYLVVVFGLFVVPKVLQRFRIPAAITCVALGALLAALTPDIVKDDTVELLATLGISAMFLFAGLEIDFREMAKERRVLVQTVILQVALIAAATPILANLMDLGLRRASLVALALLSPSTGFILDSLASLPLTEKERFWIKSKAIATELVALFLLFFSTQSTSPSRLAFSVLVMGAMVLVLPVVFRVFATRVLPFAPKTEFAFLVIIALVCAFTTRKLGVYYLVGAFVVGVAAQRFRAQLPAIASEKMVHAVEAFASFFIPFYFLKAGLHLERKDFVLPALGWGLLFLAVALPVRVAVVAVHRRIAVGEPLGKGRRVAVSLLPTLVFTLVIAEILRDRFELSPVYFGALVVFALVNTTLPSLFLRLPPPEFETPEAPIPPELHALSDVEPAPSAPVGEYDGM